VTLCPGKESREFRSINFETIAEGSDFRSEIEIFKR